MRDALGRFELMLACEAAGRKLQNSGECNHHIRNFLKQLQSVPGDDLGELFMNWHRSQAEQRTSWALLILFCMVLAALASKVLLGWFASLACVGLLAWLGIRDQQQRFQAEMAFSNELDRQARHAENCPVFARR